MSSGELLGIEPLELKFPFELKKQISCSLRLSNKNEDYVAFKVKTTNPKKYCVRPNTGVVPPHSTCDVIVTMQAQRDAPIDMQCKDKFLVQSVVANPGATVKDITPEMFTKESGNTVDECKLKVLYVPPPQPPSPVPEGSEEGSSPRPSVSDNGTLSAPELVAASRALTEPQEKSNEETLRREVSKQRAGGFSLLIVVLVALLGIFLGYLLKKIDGTPEGADGYTGYIKIPEARRAFLIAKGAYNLCFDLNPHIQLVTFDD
ncbi:hypothetical protein Taro_038785 [Colocasia esculenta]|uniref:MSP domain-containing protein n=1 Tax=Colocasia esculenta TaxID=4460 RepID=A0A843WDT8_COLES|nr:hypothetical protein [Colocasia esculenta]